MVLVVMIGVGLAEKTGYFETAMKRVIEVAPRALIIPTMILVGIIGNIAGDAGPVILPPIAAMVMIKLGYHPFAGLIMAYAATLGAFGANLVLGMGDALVAGFTEPAAQLVDPNYTANIAMNYYFMAVSAIFLLIIIYFLTTKLTIPRLGAYTGQVMDNEKLTPIQISALRWANVSAVITAIVLSLFQFLKTGCFEILKPVRLLPIRRL